MSVTSFLSVIPAQAGIQAESEPVTAARWIPAFAGMTRGAQ
jgi:hypothetical protein